MNSHDIAWLGEKLDALAESVSDIRERVARLETRDEDRTKGRYAVFTIVGGLISALVGAFGSWISHGGHNR